MTLEYIWIKQSTQYSSKYSSIPIDHLSLLILNVRLSMIFLRYTTGFK